MGRPSYFGKQVVIHNGSFVGANFGYNYYCEHEGDVAELVGRLNMHAAMLNSRSFRGLSNHKKAIKLARRWQNTSFINNILLSTVPYKTKDITVNNSYLLGRYSNFQLEAGVYTVLVIGDNIDYLMDRVFGKNGVYTEEEVFYMQDYQYFGANIGMMMSGKCSQSDMRIAANWGYSDSYIMVLEKKGTGVVGGIISALTSGNIAIINGEPRIFSDRGLCFVDLSMIMDWRA